MNPSTPSHRSSRKEVGYKEFTSSWWGHADAELIREVQDFNTACLGKHSKPHKNGLDAAYRDFPAYESKDLAKALQEHIRELQTLFGALPPVPSKGTPQERWADVYEEYKTAHDALWAVRLFCDAFVLAECIEQHRKWWYCLKVKNKAGRMVHRPDTVKGASSAILKKLVYGLPWYAAYNKLHDRIRKSRPENQEKHREACRKYDKLESSKERRRILHNPEDPFWTQARKAKFPEEFKAAQEFKVKEQQRLKTRYDAKRQKKLRDLEAKKLVEELMNNEAFLPQPVPSEPDGRGFLLNNEDPNGSNKQGSEATQNMGTIRSDGISEIPQNHREILLLDPPSSSDGTEAGDSDLDHDEIPPQPVPSELDVVLH